MSEGIHYCYDDQTVEEAAERRTGTSVTRWWPFPEIFARLTRSPADRDAGRG